MPAPTARSSHCHHAGHHHHAGDRYHHPAGCHHHACPPGEEGRRPHQERRGDRAAAPTIGQAAPPTRLPAGDEVEAAAAGGEVEVAAAGDEVEAIAGVEAEAATAGDEVEALVVAAAPPQPRPAQPLLGMSSRPPPPLSEEPRPRPAPPLPPTKPTAA
ncbi:unnamed protein product [Urochloa humidicola]